MSIICFIFEDIKEIVKGDETENITYTGLYVNRVIVYRNKNIYHMFSSCIVNVIRSE